MHERRSRTNGFLYSSSTNWMPGHTITTHTHRGSYTQGRPGHAPHDSVHVEHPVCSALPASSRHARTRPGMASPTADQLNAPPKLANGLAYTLMRTVSTYTGTPCTTHTPTPRSQRARHVQLASIHALNTPDASPWLIPANKQ